MASGKFGHGRVTVFVHRSGSRIIRMSPFDAVLLLSFGGPEGPADVLPFLERVTAGRGIPQERLAVVERQYQAFGGVSPINDQNRQLRSALEAALNPGRTLGDPDYLPVYLGNRNWDPLLADTLRQMRAADVQRAAVVVTSGYSSYSGCRQYRENLYDAVTEVESDGAGHAPELHKIRRWFDQPAFIEVMTENVIDAVRSLPDVDLADLRLAFTTHSIPLRQAESSGDPALGGNMYVEQHEFVAEAIAARVAETLAERIPWRLVYQSRSGPPAVPWLEPDISDHLDELKTQGANAVVIVPIGFMSDHMEVMWDLDTVALNHAGKIGLRAARARTVGADPRFVAALAGLVRERESEIPMLDRIALAPWGPAPDVCPVGCCANPRADRPALCGADS